MIFSALTELRIKLKKHTIIGVRRDSVSSAHIASDLDYGVDNFPIVYLGIPLGGSNLDCSGWEPVVNMFMGRLSHGSAVIFPWEVDLSLLNQFYAPFSSILCPFVSYLWVFGINCTALWVYFFGEEQMIEGNCAWWNGRLWRGCVTEGTSWFQSYHLWMQCYLLSGCIGMPKIRISCGGELCGLKVVRIGIDYFWPSISLAEVQSSSI